MIMKYQKFATVAVGRDSLVETFTTVWKLLKQTSLTISISRGFVSSIFLNVVKPALTIMFDKLGPDTIQKSLSYRLSEI